MQIGLTSRALSRGRVSSPILYRLILCRPAYLHPVQCENIFIVAGISSRFTTSLLRVVSTSVSIF